MVVITTLAAMVVAGHGYVFCNMTQQVSASCCCAVHGEANGDAADHDAIEDACCESRAAHAIAASEVAQVELAKIVASAAVASVVEDDPHARDTRGWLRSMTARHARSRASARSSPARRGKERARLAVTQC
jgi:hypothetical protein